MGCGMSVKKLQNWLKKRYIIPHEIKWPRSAVTDRRRIAGFTWGSSASIIKALCQITGVPVKQWVLWRRIPRHAHWSEKCSTIGMLFFRYWHIHSYRWSTTRLNTHYVIGYFKRHLSWHTHRRWLEIFGDSDQRYWNLPCSSTVTLDLFAAVIHQRRVGFSVPRLPFLIKGSE